MNTIEQFAKEYNLCPESVKMMTEGVLRRLDYFVENNPGAEVTEEIVQLATYHYLHHTAEYYKRVLTEESEFDALCDQIEKGLHKDA